MSDATLQTIFRTRLKRLLLTPSHTRGECTPVSVD